MINTTEELTEALKNDVIANKEIFLETELCRYVNDKLENLKVTLSEDSRTAKLWILCSEKIHISLHIDLTLRMLNLFASCGHVNYAKFVRMYIQKNGKSC